MNDQHVVTVVATRDKDENPAYRAVCSNRLCRFWHGAYRPLTKAGYARAEHDGREHARRRVDVQADVAGRIAR